MKIEDNKYTEHAKRVAKRTQNVAKKTEEISLEVMSILQKWLDDVLTPFKEEKKSDHLKK
jgi:hypothetical protein